MELAPHIKPEYRDKISKRILLHHSWNFIQGKIKPFLEDVVEFPNEDYPLVNGRYRNQDITAVTTRMGVDESLNIVDQLISLGATTFIKLGSFVALRGDIGIGDIYVPKEAVRLPGTIDAVLKYDKRALASKDLLSTIEQIATQSQVPIRIGDKVLTCPLYGPYIRDEVVDPRYSIDYWKNNCFGNEMECSAVFAITIARGAKSAAILVCNRTLAVLDDHQKGMDVEWNEHRNPKQAEYKKGYERAIMLALDSLVK